MPQRGPLTIFNFWPYNLLIDIFYKPEITQRVYLPAIIPSLDDLNDNTAKSVILWRYRDGLKLQKIGDRLDLTAERSRQIQVDTLSKMRHPMFAAKLLTISPTEAAALNRRIRELSKACGEAVPEPVTAALTADSPIEALNLSTRSYNGLRRMRVRMLGDLANLTPSDLLNARGMGVSSLREIAASIEPYGISLKPESED